MIGHSGSDNGVFTSLYFDRDKGNAIVILMNRTPDLRTEQAMERLVERIKKELLSV